MKRLLVCCFALAALAAAAFRWLPAPTPLALPEPTTATSPTPPQPPEEKVTLRTNADATEVFRRAFWREPAADDRIVHAERREWVSEENGVRRWLWFIAVEPGPDLAQWLRERNPFDLVTVEADARREIDAPPAWFPRVAEMKRGEVQQAGDGSMTLIFDRQANRVYGTDAGRGFAVARAAVTPPLRIPGPGFDPAAEVPRRLPAEGGAPSRP